MSQVLTIDPVTRLEGHLRATATVDYVQGQLQVVDAQISGTLFRGFENILVGRSPLDAPDLCERICGVCTVSHGLAACRALERAAGMTFIPSNARIMRNLILAADMLHSHILHFYALSLADFAELQPMPPWTPAWLSDRRLSGSGAAQLAAHYSRALEIRRKAHEMGALFAGKLPHSPAFVPGGITTTPRQARIDAFRAYAGEVLSFVQNEYQADVNLIAATYSDYYSIGAGTRNLIAYGSFDLDDAGSSQLFRSGVVQDASAIPAALDVNLIEEDITRAWYQTGTSFLRVNCGGTAHTDGQGSTWSADYGYNSGSARSTGVTIQGTNEQALYQTWRLAAVGTPLIYTFNVPNGDYTIKLMFDETYWTQAGQRVFDVAINGQTVLPGFDILAAGGLNTAVDRQFQVTVANGQIAIQLTSLVDRAKICGIEIAGGAVQPPPATQIRVNGGGTAYTDTQGSAWSADYGYNSGSARSTTVNIQGTNEQALYRTWRLAAIGTPLIYTYNVPNGDYTIKLMFDETYWMQAGQRVFDVAINGQIVLPSFDILAAGGLNTAVDRQFQVTVANGQIVIQLTSIVDRAKVCGIEIVGSATQAQALAQAQAKASPTTQVRVNGGGIAYTDTQGSAWSVDYGYNSGSARSTGVTIQGTNEQALYQTWRLAAVGTPLIYTFNVPNGDYTIKLMFDETYWTQAGQRVFDVAINGQTVLPGFDILAAGGLNTAVDRQFQVTVANGQIAIQLTSLVDRAKICAIEIVGGQPHVGQHPFEGTTTPVYPKTGAYSWAKAPRYGNAAYEAGPLARMWINGDYRNGISVMDRHMARFQEALMLAQQLDAWAQQLLPTGPVYQQYAPPTSGSGYGLTEAPRGALGHWVKITNGKISLYQVVTPTCWNASPRDSNGAPGPIEKALLGLPVQNTDEPVEIVRVIHSFDPCLACAVHVLRPSGKGSLFRL